jgi:Transposase IS116/IS110/IS902 family
VGKTVGRYGDRSLAIYAQRTFDAIAAATRALDPDAEIYLSQPGLGTILGARVLAEFGDDADRYVDAKARKNYAGTTPDHSPIRQKESRPDPLCA